MTVYDIVNKLKKLFGNLNKTFEKFDDYLQSTRTFDRQAEITRWKVVVYNMRELPQHVTSCVWKSCLLNA